VAFDKTGTLTQGHPRLTDWQVPADAPESWNKALALRIAAALQSGSEHPLAKAVLDVANAAPSVDGDVIKASDIQAVPGRGIQATLASSEWAGQWGLGSTRWMREQTDVAASSTSQEQGLQAQAQQWASGGATVSWLMFKPDGAAEADRWRVMAVMAFGDEIKPGAAQAVARLHALGVQTVMISGDNRGAAESMARQLGIKQVMAEVLPSDKADHIQRLQTGPSRQRQIVAMVGDGLNDAPALAAADVGMAMANPEGGTDVALQAAGITLMRGDPMLVPAALEISRRTSAKIWQNLAWAFGYNIIGIPLAAFGGLNPMLAGAAMALSSVSVVTNALWLSRWRPRLSNDIA
jgi:Cu+-exporting ATPase